MIGIAIAEGKFCSSHYDLFLITAILFKIQSFFNFDYMRCIP